MNNFKIRYLLPPKDMLTIFFLVQLKHSSDLLQRSYILCDFLKKVKPSQRILTVCCGLTWQVLQKKKTTRKGIKDGHWSFQFNLFCLRIQLLERYIRSDNCNCKDKIYFFVFARIYQLYRKSCSQSTHIEAFVLNNQKYMFEYICYISPVNGKKKTLYYFFMIDSQNFTFNFYI